MENINLKRNGESLNNENVLSISEDPHAVKKKSDKSQRKFGTESDKSQQDKEKKCIEKMQEKDIQGGNGINRKVIKFLNDLQKIIKDDESRFDKFENMEQKVSASYVSYSTDMSIDEIESEMESLKQNIINKFNKNFNQFRDMDLKIMKLDKENLSLKAEMKTSKSDKFEKVQKSDTSIDSKNNYKSLVEPINNKRNQMQLNQMKEEIKILEKDNEDLQKEKNNFRRDVRKYKSEVQELKEDLKELEEKSDKYEIENKCLKKQIKEFKNQESSASEEEVSDLKKQIVIFQSQIEKKNETISNLKEEIQEKNEKMRSVEKSTGNLNLSLPEKDIEIKRLRDEIQSLIDEKKSLQENAIDENSKLEDKMSKKNEAIKKMKEKIDEKCEENKKLLEENDTLKAKCIQLESERDKKQSALSVLRDKIASHKSMEKEVEKLKITTQQLTSKEREVQRLTKEQDELKKAMDDKSKECELLKKEKLGFQEEINNMKLLNFKSKN